MGKTVKRLVLLVLVSMVAIALFNPETLEHCSSDTEIAYRVNRINEALLSGDEDTVFRLWEEVKERGQRYTESVYMFMDREAFIKMARERVEQLPSMGADIVDDVIEEVEEEPGC